MLFHLQADVLSALGWSMLAGLSTSIGGAFIFCVTKIDARTNAVMLGFVRQLRHYFACHPTPIHATPHAPCAKLHLVA